MYNGSNLNGSYLPISRIKAGDPLVLLWEMKKKFLNWTPHSIGKGKNQDDFVPFIYFIIGGLKNIEK